MILLIDNYDSFTYNLYQDLAQKTTVEVVRNDQLTVADITSLEPRGIVLSPGPGRPEKAGMCIEVIRHFSGQVPILGVCLGHQAIACAFGSKVIQAPEIMHGKSSLVYHDGSDLFQNMPLPFYAGRYHSLLVETQSLSPNLQICAETAQGLIMAMRHTQHPTFGVQFHPESILTENGTQLFNNFMQLCEA